MHTENAGPVLFLEIRFLWAKIWFSPTYEWLKHMPTFEFSMRNSTGTATFIYSIQALFSQPSGKTAMNKMTLEGLPWWRSGWESACSCRGHGSWSGKIPHDAEQLGPWATTAEPACLEPVLRNKRGRDSERPAHHDEERSPLATTRESPRTEKKTQHVQK